MEKPAEIPAASLMSMLRPTNITGKCGLFCSFLVSGVAIHAFVGATSCTSPVWSRYLGNLCGEKADLIDLSTRLKLWYATPEKGWTKLCIANCRRKWDGDENYV